MRPDSSGCRASKSWRGWYGMTDETLTLERILDVAEDVLRRFEPAKTTVIDVARALGVSHGSVYRHFPSKAALRDVVTDKHFWLERSKWLSQEAILAIPLLAKHQ